MIYIIAVVALVVVAGLWRILADGRKLRARQEQEHRRRVAEEERLIFSPAALAARAAEYRRMNEARTRVPAPLLGLPEDDEGTKTWPAVPGR